MNSEAGMPLPETSPMRDREALIVDCEIVEEVAANFARWMQLAVQIDCREGILGLERTWQH